jgi:hypothetical protein
MLPCVALVRTDVSEERNVSIIRVTRIDELGSTLAVTGNRHTLRRNKKWAHIVFLCSGRRLLVTANFLSSQILVTLMKEALSSSETSVLTRTTRGNMQKTPLFIVTNMFILIQDRFRKGWAIFGYFQSSQAERYQPRSSKALGKDEKPIMEYITICHILKLRETCKICNWGYVMEK